MKISAITARVSIASNIKNKSDKFSNSISFGVGEDYGNDEFLEPTNYQPKKGNLLEYLKGIGQFFYLIIRELDDNYAFRDGPTSEGWGGEGEGKEIHIPPLDSDSTDSFLDEF